MIKNHLKAIIVAAVVLLAILSIVLILIINRNNSKKFTDATWVFNQQTTAYGKQKLY